MSVIKSARQGLEDRISEVAERAYQKYRRAVQPIYGTKGGRPAHVGTCFYLKVNDQPYVITAAHVIDESETSTLYLPLGRRLVAIGGEFACTNIPSGGRQADRYDFAYAAADEAYFTNSERAICIEETDISLNRVSVETHAYMVIGYPRSQNKKLDNAEKTVRPKLWHYYGTGRTVADLYQRLEISGDDHISFKYEEQSRTVEGACVNSIYPRGMSGGPVIDLGAQSPPTDNTTTEAFDGRLSGIFIECYEDTRVLLSVKINLLLEKIRARAGEGASIAPDLIG
jgi:hypothetical protein